MCEENSREALYRANPNIVEVHFHIHTAKLLYNENLSDSFSLFFSTLFPALLRLYAALLECCFDTHNVLQSEQGVFRPHI